jgi:hypothetical protein
MLGVNFLRDSIDCSYKFNKKAKRVNRIRFSLDMEVYNWGFNYCVTDSGKFVKLDEIFKNRDGTEVRGRNLNSFLADRFIGKYGDVYKTHRYDGKISREVVGDYPIRVERWHFDGTIFLNDSSKKR